MPPSHGRQFGAGLQVEGWPVGFAALERQQKLAVRIGHLSDDVGNQCFTRRKQGLEFDRLSRHADETSVKFYRNIFAPHRQNFGHGAVVADQVDEEGPTQRIVDAFIRQKITHVEQIAWMLTVEGGDNLAGIEIGKRDDPHFGKAEFVFHAG